MAEQPLCVYCDEPINLVMDEYVITNKYLVDDPAQYRYACVECQKKKAKEKLTAA